MLPKPLENVQDLLRQPVGLINKGLIYLLQQLDPQNLCNFEVIFIPKTDKGILESLKATGTSVKDFITNFSPKDLSAQKMKTTYIADQLIASIMIDSITPNFSSIEYERVGNTNYVSGISHPEDVTITFLESETGFVRLYLNAWMNEILTVTDDSRIVFRGDQEKSKKNAFIIPLQKIGLPSSMWIMLKGIKLKSIEPMTWEQSSGEMLKISATFSVDLCWMSTF